MKNGAIGPIPHAQTVLNVFDFRKEQVAGNSSNTKRRRQYCLVLSLTLRG